MLWLELAPGGSRSLPQNEPAVMRLRCAFAVKERCYAMALTFTACSPSRSAVTSKDTFCFCLRDLEV